MLTRVVRLLPINLEQQKRWNAATPALAMPILEC